MFTRIAARRPRHWILILAKLQYRAALMRLRRLRVPVPVERLAADLRGISGVVRNLHYMTQIWKTTLRSFAPQFRRQRSRPIRSRQSAGLAPDGTGVRVSREGR
jgi:hypothetical protein